MVTSRAKIIAAFVVGVLLVILAYWLRVQNPTTAVGGNLAVVDRGSVRQHIDTADQDQDGIPDWQEALQRTEPVTIESATSTYEVPDTLTGQFAIQFFQDMVRSEQYGAFGSNPEELVGYAAQTFAAEATDTLLGANDIVLNDDTSQAAIKAYANQMASIALDYTIPVGAPNELEILKQALDTGNAETLNQLEPYIDGYERILARSLAVPVPRTYSKEHLDLVNVYQAILNDIIAMRGSYDDPLNALIRIKRYQEDASTLSIAVLNLYQRALSDGIRFNASDPANQFLP